MSLSGNDLKLWCFRTKSSDVSVGLSDSRVTGPYHDIILSYETSVKISLSRYHR